MSHSDPKERDDETQPIIEFCLNNVSQKHRKALSRRDAPTRGCACLQRCGDCAVEPFAVIDGRYVVGNPLEIVSVVTDRGNAE